MHPAPSAGTRVRASHDWFDFAFHWLRRRHEFCKLITERSEAKPNVKQLSTLSGKPLEKEKCKPNVLRRWPSYDNVVICSIKTTAGSNAVEFAHAYLNIYIELVIVQVVSTSNKHP